MDPNDPTRLFRKQIFSRVTPHAPETTANEPTPDPGDVDSPLMFCLAVALLELTFGKPLCQFQEKGGIFEDQAHQRKTAKRLTREIHKHEDEKFASVVIKCMNPSPSSPHYDFSFENESFRRRFIQDVLAPLHEGVTALRR